MGTEILWVGFDEHRLMWRFHFEALREELGIEVILLTNHNKDAILKECVGKNAVVFFHSGRWYSIPDINEIISSIKKQFPTTKIGLETLGAYRYVNEKFIDFCILSPISVDEFLREIQKQII